MKTIDKAWQPEKFEENLYQRWEKAGYFKPEVNPGGEPFSIIMPPPNANGSLHIGHAVFVTLEDIMIRYARLKGKAALWLPGADHAGFETQVVFEKKLEKEGKSRFQIPRDELYQMMWDFTQENKKAMEAQLKKLGASCDWQREKFTLDPDIIKIVYETFKKLYDDGLAYRAFRLVNWCPKHQTSLSDLEVKYEERQDPLYYIKYGPITVATTRPETMFGDVAIAVNPNDEGYKDLIGKSVPLPLTDRDIPVIADEAVDMKFGTGAVKVTPAHDPTDFEIGQRHGLEILAVIDDRGRLANLEQAKAKPQIIERLSGKRTAEARALVAEELDELVEKRNENYLHSVGVCYKCQSVIEPLPREQWFIAVNKPGKSGKILAKDALKVVKDGRVKFVTKRFEKIFTHWMENIRDWNISRQIVWGIRIPAWYCQNCSNEVATDITYGAAVKEGTIPGRISKISGKPIVTEGEKPEKCPDCGCADLVSDPDVFDTWFSSGQWPFAALQTTKPSDFEKFYPTSVMETGWDILFFWVARMIMLGLYVTDKVPFKHVFLHGLVRDKDRQKMSKSKGNVINPLGVAEQYGTDAVRMALVFGVAAGNDVIISEEKIRGMRNFANKIWNASRYVILRVSEGDLKTGVIGTDKLSDLDFIEGGKHTVENQRMLNEHESLKKETTRLLSDFKFSLAGEKLYDYFWHTFADIYIEETKIYFDKHSDEQIKKNTKKALVKVLSETLIMLHPFMPFVTEAVWQELREISPDLVESIMIAEWPK
ncbi:MAG: valine--tRNA ligase [Patescibacteria group bacterium]